MARPITSYCQVCYFTALPSRNHIIWGALEHTAHGLPITHYFTSPWGKSFCLMFVRIHLINNNVLFYLYSFWFDYRGRQTYSKSCCPHPLSHVNMNWRVSWRKQRGTLQGLLLIYRDMRKRYKGEVALTGNSLIRNRVS